MIRIQTRLSPSHSDIGRSLRRYSLELCHHAIELAGKIGIRAASIETGVPYRRLVRLVCAHRRSTQTLQEALDDIRPSAIFTTRCGCRKFPMPDVAADRLARDRANLLIRVEAAREGYQIAKRTGASLWKCIHMAAQSRGLGGKSVCELVREGRIPEHWIK